MARAKIQAVQNDPNAANNEIDTMPGAGSSATAPCVAANNCFLQTHCMFHREQL